MIDNIQVAILTKVNELAERHGMRPYQFCAAVRFDEDPSRITLKFEVPVSANSAKTKSFNKMLDLIGFAEDTHALTGSAGQIIDALDNALHRSPNKQRPRF